MIYCDGSLLVAVLLPERNSAVATAWLGDRGPAPIAVSHWTDVEVASALAMKLRLRELSVDDHRRVARAWEQLRAGCEVLEVNTSDFHHAVDLVHSGPSGLRSGDALHVAIATRRSLPMATLDRGMAAGAEAAGVTCTLIGAVS